MEKGSRRLRMAIKKIEEAMRIIEDNGVGIGASISQAKAYDALATARNLIKVMEQEED